ncbi:Serine/threonine-protein kinase AfsK [Symmachiella dynata]|uniref:outer membrane protein assembly factor BamB family protein n=1 Tax=Symmachiella dynata TaxID=2527995 RepID=UPI00118AAE06|nr:PQQ-binding-like beta-propeller repeat protein [Symmachiella dynata]QDT50182.1 Serine/threonine-protein kinase AfsK [Symmachiella dynata]
MLRITLAGLLFVGYLWAGLSTVVAGDWPTWRYDSQRSAAAPDALSAKLHLQWTLQRPPSAPAWPEDPRLQFDAGYEPIVVGNTLYVGSARNDSLTAITASTGDEKWKFFAGGPIRFAPVFTEGRLYFGADDGVFYCLDAETGTVVWQHDTAPTNRKVIGNGRLTSVWPMRGGPVLSDGKIQFTTGVWPFEGVMLYTLDLQNADATDEKPHMTSTVLADSAPQGYAVVAGDRLFLPCGRERVLARSLSTGKPIGMKYDSRGKTDFHAIAAGDWLFHGDKIFHVQDQLLADVEARRPVVADNMVYGVQGGNVVALDLADPQYTETKDRRGKLVKQLSLANKWELSYADIVGKAEGDAAKWLADNPLTIHLKAGNRLYGYQAGQVFAIDLPTENSPANKTWSAAIEGTPTSMVAAADKLFVVTQEGKFYCFGAEKTDPRHHKPESVELASTDAATAEKVAALLKASPSDTGYALVMGVSDGGLIEELLLQSQLPVIAVDQDAAKIDAVRRKLDAAGVYGTRVSAHVGRPLEFGLPPYMASLITSEDAQSGDISDAASVIQKTFQILRPYGGAAYLATSDVEHEMLVHFVAALGLANAEVRRVGELSSISREGSLPGAADWTHEYGDTANTLMSKDKLVKAPLGVLWFGGPAADGDLFYNRHYWGPSLTVIGGRMFLQGPNKLSAVDIYTGRVLWQMPLKDSDEIQPGRRGNDFEEVIAGFNFVAMEDGIYLVNEQVCRRYDPATGKVMSEFTLPKAEGQWGRFRVYEDLLIAEVFREVPGKGRLPVELQAIDRNSGETVWKKTAKFSFPFVAINGGKLYCFDGMIQDLYLDWKRRGKIPEAGPDRDVVAMDVRSGKEFWRYTTDMIATWLSYSQENDVLMVSNNKGMIAYRGKDGKELWRKYAQGKGFAGHPENLWDRVILWKDQVIDQRGPGLAYNIATGESIQRKHPVTDEEIDWEFTKKGHHCNYAIANEHLLTFRAGDAGFCDVETGTTSRLTGFRSGCRNSLIPAGGVLNAPNMAHGCVCGYSIFTSLALVHVPDADLWTYGALKKPDVQPRQLAVNFGAPGDRVDETGMMWLDYPSVGGTSPDVEVKVTGDNPSYYRNHSARIHGSDLKWVAASGVEGAEEITIKLPGRAKQPRNYTVRLYFAEPDDISAGHRQFNVSLQDQQLLADLDVAKAAGGAQRILVKEFKEIAITEELKISLTPGVGRPVLCGVAIAAEN